MPVQMGDSGKERKRYGHDFPLFAWETVELMRVDNVSIIIRVLSAFPWKRRVLGRTGGGRRLGDHNAPFRELPDMDAGEEKPCLCRCDGEQYLESAPGAAAQGTL